MLLLLGKMKKIKILYDFLSELGGLERVMFFQAKELSKNNKVELAFSYINQKEKSNIIKELGLSPQIKIVQLGGTNNQIIQLMSSLLNPNKIKVGSDLIISHSFMTSRMAHKNKKKNGSPYVVMLHHPPNFLYNRDIRWANNFPRFLAYALGFILGPILKRLDKTAVKGADAVFVNSKYTKRRADCIYGIDSLVIYPPVEKKFKIVRKENARKALDRLGINKKFVLLHGRIIKDKRPDLAIKAFSKIKNKELKLVISGTIDEERNIRKLISELGLEKRVKIIGRVSEEELIALYNLAECFLMPAPGEDFGMTSIEAMACGCPVIAWGDNAGPEEIIQEGRNGLLAEPYNVKHFAAKIEHSLKKRWNKKKISAFTNRFSEKQISQKLNLAIKKILV